jgi:cytochrome b
MPHKKGFVYVWPLSARIIHWTIALSFTLSFITAFYHNYFTAHIAFGYLFALSLLFRLVWGFVGPNYATFKTFTLSFKALKLYFTEKMRDRWRPIHPGHNPASSWFTLIVLGMGLSIALSGLVLFGIQEGSGPLNSLNSQFFRFSSLWERMHRSFSYILLLWALIHIVGVLTEQFYHRTRMVLAMISGYKPCLGEDALVSPFQHFLTYGAIVVHALVFILLLYGDNETFLTRSLFQAHHYEQENKTYATFCTKCHKPYPPFMLPQGSWVKMMEGLTNHFGEEITDSNLSREDKESIQAYLLSNSAEFSSHKLAFKTLDSLGELRPLSITKSPYWRESHTHLSPELFKHPLVKDKSNCFACHKGFENGIFDNRFIHLPE